MKRLEEDDIVHTGAASYVIRVKEGYEVRAHYSCASVVVGFSKDQAAAIRTAEALDRYPRQVKEAIDKMPQYRLAVAAG